MVNFFLGLLTSSCVFELLFILYFCFFKEKRKEVYSYDDLKSLDSDEALKKSDFFR